VNDILAVLNEQTTQAEALIAQLSDRLTQTRQLQALELERRKTEAQVAGLETRLKEIDQALAQLRQQAAGFDPGRYQAATAQLDRGWRGLGGETLPHPAITSRLAVAAPPEPAPEPRQFRAEEPASAAGPGLGSTAGPAEESAPEPVAPAAALDAESVLGSFLGQDWNSPAGHNFFSAAEELTGGELDDW